MIMPDLPGHGESEPDPSVLSLGGMSEWLTHVLDKLEIEHAYVVGHSMGGYIMLPLAERHPERVNGLCFFHSTPAADAAEKKENRNKTIGFLETYGKDAFLRTFVQELVLPQNRHLAPQLKQIASATDSESMIRFTAAMRDREDYSQKIKLYNKPVAFIAGENDPFSDTEKLRQIAAEVKNSHWLDLKNAAHSGMMEAPEESAKFIAEWIS